MPGNVTSEADSTLVPEGSPVCTRAQGYLDKLVGRPYSAQALETGKPSELTATSYLIDEILSCFHSAEM